MSSRRNVREQVDDDDDEWLFESIIAFLSSPIWSIPIQHFIESNCSIFSPNDSWSGGALLDDEDEDENLENVPTVLIDVHLKYKDLVDTLINSFLQDIGVSYSQFTRACKRTNTLSENSIYLDMFEQVWSAENFRMFKSQMVRKNIELELQALVLLQYQLGLIKSGSGQMSDAKSADDEIMALVIKKSVDEYDYLMNSRKVKSHDLPIQRPQDLELAKQLVKSDELVENLKSELDQQEYKNNQIVKEAIKNPSTSDRPASARKNRLNEQFQNMKIRENSFIENNRRNEDDEDIVSNNNKSSKVVNDIAQTFLAQSGGNLSQNEIERRAEFMRKQRDILTERKRVERQKQLDDLVHDSKINGQFERPMSSRAARSVLSGADPTQMKDSISSGSSRSDEERKKIEARKALAETLRKEVVNNSKK